MAEVFEAGESNSFELVLIFDLSGEVSFIISRDVITQSLPAVSLLRRGKERISVIGVFARAREA